MLNFLEKTYRGRLREWWLETGVLLLLSIGMCFLTCSIFLSYTDYQALLKAGDAQVQRLETIEHSYHEDPVKTLAIQSAFYAYTQLFIDFQNKHPLAVRLRFYQPARIYTAHVQRLGVSLTHSFAVPVLRDVTEKLRYYSQEWEIAPMARRIQIQPEYQAMLGVYWSLIDKTQVVSSEQVQQRLVEIWLKKIEKVDIDNSDMRRENLHHQVDTLVRFYINQVDSRLLVEQLKIDNPLVSDKLLAKIQRHLKVADSN